MLKLFALTILSLFLVGCSGFSSNSAGTSAKVSSSSGSFTSTGAGTNGITANGGTSPSPSPSSSPQTLNIAASTFNILSPSQGANISSGVVTISGQAGSQWLNVGAFPTTNGTIQWNSPLAVNVTPSGGVYSLNIDLSTLPSGSNTVSVIAFNVPKGQTATQMTPINLNLNLQSSSNPAPSPNPSPAPAPTPSPAPAPAPTPSPAPAPSPAPSPSPSPAPSPSPSPSPGTTPTITGTTYYVSPSGNDANAGTSQSAPWKTMAKVNSFTYKAGDGVLFQGGQSFSGCLNLTPTNLPGTSPTAGFTLSSYGTGQATLQANCTGAYNWSSPPLGDPNIDVGIIGISGVNGINISNLILRGLDSGAGTTNGVVLMNSFGSISYVSITNCDIGGFWAQNTGHYGAEIHLAGWSAGMDHIYIANNVLHGLHGHGSFDENGIMTLGYGKNIQYFTAEKNIIYDMGGQPGKPGAQVGSGIAIGGVTYGLIQYNVAHDLGGNQNGCGGPSNFWSASSDHVVFQFNEGYRNQPLNGVYPGAGCDWDGFDIDGDNTNSIMQYNYSHDNFGSGFLFYVNNGWSGGTPQTNPWGNNIMRYNISINDGTWHNSTFSCIGLGGDGTLMPSNMFLHIYNNTCINVDPQGGQEPMLYTQGGSFAGYILNNIFLQDDKSAAAQAPVFWNYSASSPSLSFSNNDYYSDLGQALVNSILSDTWGSQTTNVTKPSSFDKAALTSSPLFVAPASATSPTCFTNTTPTTPQDLGNCLKAKMGYLQNSSPLRGAGVDVTKSPYNAVLSTVITSYSGTSTQPAMDFFGVQLSSQSPNLGADGH